MPTLTRRELTREHSKWTDFYRVLAQEEGREGHTLIPRPQGVDSSSADLNALVAQLKAVAILEKLNDYRTVDPDTGQTLHNAGAYLKLKVRMLLREQDWLMDYMVAYATHYWMEETR